ncbi:PUA-like domain-containing protein [Fennellomyces sp. T-0311]|nr:PUA-like domain-containing protein [Fennellomyces sp. T-0311]
MSDEHSLQRAGFLVKQGTVELLAASGRYKRIIRGNLDRETFMNQTSIWKKHIIGPIPTVPTGFRTENKKQLASVGVHRAIQAGIDGSVDLQKVFSIVMSGEYGEDEDRGDEVVYTGSGGRDASGQQTFDQTLDRRNMLLAKCCAADVNSIDGADAGENWRQGVPIRVIRGAGVARHDDASYCPAEGYRYDGVYKVQQYWPSQGYSGHRVWRFILKRDDRSPAPYSTDDKYTTECMLY